MEDLGKLRESAALVHALGLEHLTTPEDLGESAMALAMILDAQDYPPQEVVRGLLLGVARYSLSRGISPQGVGEALAHFIHWEDGPDPELTS